MAMAAEEKVSLNFVNADIVEVIKAVSQISQKNFLIDPRVKGTINIVSAKPVPPSLAYEILLSALRLQGFAAVEANGVTKIVPESDAKLYISSANKGGNGDSLVTRVYILKYESATQLVPILRPLIASNNVVAAYPNNNALVITDYASNLRRIEQIIESIDQPVSEAPVVIPLQYSSAVDLAQIITRLMADSQLVVGGNTDASQRFVLLADVRSNSLLLRTDSPAKVHRVRELVEKLDVRTNSPGNIHVVYLKNSDATKLAQTLRAVLSGDTSAVPVPGSPQSSAAGLSASVSGGGTIQADAASNSLIITAPEAVYNNMRAVIEQLDVRRAQVFVEALIAEVTADKAAEFGIQWQGLSGGTETQVGGGTNFGGAGSNIITVTNGILNGTPVIDPGLNIGVLRGRSLGMLARALETDANANILSTPNLLTLDNEEAKIIIGQNVPFITGSYAQTGSTTTASPFQTIERKDVGLTLRIKPQISQGNTVKMQIYQEVSSVQDLKNAAGVITNKRSLESVVLADEGQIIVLGGLVQDSVSEGQDKVPVLGDIPLLGALFRHETRHRTKTNLMIFIRPFIMRTAEAYQGVTQDRYNYIRGEQTDIQMPSRWTLPDMNSPTLQPLPQSAPVAPTAPAPEQQPKQ
ncbi:MAG TPA: type II secretion system secretin GspD [Gallionellaceae bacterium]